MSIILIVAADRDVAHARAQWAKLINTILLKHLIDESRWAATVEQHLRRRAEIR